MEPVDVVRRMAAIANSKNGYGKVIARLTKSAEAISELPMGLPCFARNDK